MDETGRFLLGVLVGGVVYFSLLGFGYLWYEEGLAVAVDEFVAAAVGLTALIVVVAGGALFMFVCVWLAVNGPETVRKWRGGGRE